jgi:hypothetical protein
LSRSFHGLFLVDVAMFEASPGAGEVGLVEAGGVMLLNGHRGSASRGEGRPPGQVIEHACSEPSQDGEDGLHAALRIGQDPVELTKVERRIG